MITTFNEYTGKRDLINQPFSDQEKVVQEYVGTFERKMLILENPWNYNLFNDQSVKPFLSNIGNLISQNIKVGYGYIDSKQGLSYYIRYPDGLIWSNPETYGTSVFLFETHSSSKNGLELQINTVTKQDLLDNCNGFSDFSNILFFGGCGLFNGSKGKEFGNEILRVSGSRGIFGFSSPNLSFATGTIVEILFLSTLFLYNIGDPFKHLPDIYESVLIDFPPARSEDVGFTMFFNAEYP
jgi:hypothetical protein